MADGPDRSSAVSCEGISAQLAIAREAVSGVLALCYSATFREFVTRDLVLDAYGKVRHLGIRGYPLLPHIESGSLASQIAGPFEQIDQWLTQQAEEMLPQSPALIDIPQRAPEHLRSLYDYFNSMKAKDPQLTDKEIVRGWLKQRPAIARKARNAGEFKCGDEGTEQLVRSLKSIRNRQNRKRENRANKQESVAT